MDQSDLPKTTEIGFKLIIYSTTNNSDVKKDKLPIESLVPIKYQQLPIKQTQKNF